MSRKLSRRRFLSGLGVTAAGAALAACQPKTVVVEKEVEKEVTKVVEVEKVVKETVIVEGTPKVVEKTVKETVEVLVEVTEPPVSPETVTIIMWDEWYAPENAGTPSAQLAEIMYENFRSQYPNIEIDHRALPPGTDVRQAFIEANAGGTPPDVFSTYPPSMNPYWDQDFLLNMDEYVNIWSLKDDVIDALWYDALIENHYYGVPNYFYGMTLVWRKDLFAEEGLTQAPANWNEMVEFGQMLTKPEKKQYGYGLLGMAWASWYWENFVWQAGGEVTTRLPDGKVELTFTDEPGVAALQFYQDLKYKYAITQENVLQAYDENVNDFIAGRTTMYMLATDRFAWCIEQGLTFDQFGTAPLPAGPGSGAAQIGGAYWTINTAYDQVRRDASWTWIEWRTDPQTHIFRWKMENDLGMTPGVDLPIYKGILDQAEFQDLPEEWVETSDATSRIAHTEYIFKDKLEPYFAAPVQDVLTDPNADCKAVLVEASKKMVAEIEGTVLHPSAL